MHEFTMVLCKNGVDSNFNADLLRLISRNKNEEFVRALEKYRQTQSFWTVSRMVDSSNATLLHYAAEYGNSFIVKYLINSNCEIDTQDIFGRTPLMLAALNNHREAVEILLSAGAEIHLVGVQGKSALRMIFDRRSMIDVLFQHVTLNRILKVISPGNLAKILRRAGFTLKQAVLLKKVKLVKLLLDQGCFSVFDKDSTNGETALHTAVKNELSNMAEMLVQCGAEVDAVDSNKATPMYYLYSKSENDNFKCLELLKVLMTRAISLTTSNDQHRMQIYRVLVHGCREAVRLVLKSINNLNVHDIVGNTVVHYLARNSNAEAIETLRGREFNVNKRNADSYTPLHFAAFAISFHAVKFLLENKADVDARGHSYETPLQRLFLNLKSVPKHADARRCVELLLEYGSDARDYDVLGNFDWISKCYNGMILAGDNDADGILTLVEPILTRLAIDKVINGNEVDEFTESMINLQPSWIRFFDCTCEREFKRMRKTKICGNVTLFEFLTDSARKIGAYARNEELVSELKKFIDKLESSSPYSTLLKKRLAKATRYAKLKEHTIPAVYQLINVENNVFYSIAEYVVDYLDFEEMKNVYLACNEKRVRSLCTSDR